MQGWSIMARALVGAAALTMAAAVPAQDAPAIPRGDGYAELERLPDFTGVWTLGIGAGGRAPAQPQLTPAAQERLDAFRAKQAAEGVSQEKQIKCIPPGMPGIMRQPYPLEFLFTPGRVTIFAETYTQARRIYTDGRPLPEDPDPFFNGYSVGRWEGDTLLVDTIGFNERFWLDRRGLPHTNQMHTIEKFTRTHQNAIAYEITVDDPGAYTAPWKGELNLSWEPNTELFEYMCQQANYATELMVGDGETGVGKTTNIVP